MTTHPKNRSKQRRCHWEKCGEPATVHIAFPVLDTHGWFCDTHGSIHLAARTLGAVSA